MNKSPHDAKVLERQTKATNRYNELMRVFNNCFKGKYKLHVVKV